jgi:hypothetical protein
MIQKAPYDQYDRIVPFYSVKKRKDYIEAMLKGWF